MLVTLAVQRDGRYSALVTSAKRLHYSYAEYLELLERSDFKLEYCDGVVYTMAGDSIAHAQLGAAAIRLLSGALSGCTVFSSGLEVRVEATGLSTFPDVSVVCGPVAASSLDQHAIKSNAGVGASPMRLLGR